MLYPIELQVHAYTPEDCAAIDRDILPLGLSFPPEQSRILGNRLRERNKYLPAQRGCPGHGALLP